LSNVLEPLSLDASQLACWPGAADGSLAGVCCFNVFHISPVAVLEGVIAGASAKLRDGGFLFLYGPYAVDGKIEPQSNVNFDSMLRGLNPEFGLRDIAMVQSLCAGAGNLALVERIFVEASNNFLLCIKKVPLSGL
jgi:hypothetical protein